MKLTLTEQYPNTPDRTVTIENREAETFEEVVNLFKAAALAIGFAPATVNDLTSEREAFRDCDELCETVKSLRERLEENREPSLAEKVMAKVFKKK